MYRYKLLKNDKQIYSSNFELDVKSWMLSDKRHPSNWEAEYKIVDGLKTGAFKPARRALS